MDKAIRVQTLDEAVYISHNTDILGKGMHATVLLAMNKL